MSNEPFSETCGCIAGGNAEVNGRKSISCSTELYENGETFRVYFLSFLHQNVAEYRWPEEIIEIGSNPKMIFKISEDNDVDRILVGFVFEKEEWDKETYLDKIEFMKEYMGFCNEGIYSGIDFVNKTLTGYHDEDSEYDD